MPINRYSRAAVIATPLTQSKARAVSASNINEEMPPVSGQGNKFRSGVQPRCHASAEDGHFLMRYRFMGPGDQ